MSAAQRWWAAPVVWSPILSCLKTIPPHLVLVTSLIHRQPFLLSPVSCIKWLFPYHVLAVEFLTSESSHIFSYFSCLCQAFSVHGDTNRNTDTEVVLSHFPVPNKSLGLTCSSVYQYVICGPPAALESWCFHDEGQGLYEYDGHNVGQQQSLEKRGTRKPMRQPLQVNHQ